MNVIETTHISEEDQGRVEAYALLSRLFYAPPDDALLQQLAAAPREGLGSETEGLASHDYPTAVAALQRVAGGTDVEALRIEYDELFVGAGRAAVSPYTSGYAVPHAPDRHVLALREQLAALGLARREAVFEVEDHVSALCDVMRWLIAQDQPVEVQMSFFDQFVFRGVNGFCDAIDASAATDFYRAVAGFARAFLTVEREAFALLGES